MPLEKEDAHRFNVLVNVTTLAKYAEAVIVSSPVVSGYIEANCIEPISVVTIAIKATSVIPVSVVAYRWDDDGVKHELTTELIHLRVGLMHIMSCSVH